MQIRVASIFVDDQDNALAFHAEKLGLVTKHDIPLGEYRWLTVVAPNGGRKLSRGSSTLGRRQNNPIRPSA